MTRISEARRLATGAVKTPWRIAREKLGDFPDMMRNRAAIGTFRYSDPRLDAAEAFEHAGQSGDDLLRLLKQKVAIFEMTRNHEMLVDVATYAALLYRFDDHQSAYFSAEDQGQNGNYQRHKAVAAECVMSWSVPTTTA